jgi:hypothetical protein
MRAKVSFEQALGNCLQDLARTGDVETSLRRYPQYADRLRPLLEMAQAAHRHYQAVPEAPGGLAAGRERLLSIAAQQRAGGVSATPATTTVRMRSRRIKLVYKFVVFLLVAALSTAVLGGGAIWAAKDSLPGDLLYPVKLAAEDVRLALASAPGGQVDLALQFVEERTGEVGALVATGRQVPDGAIARMERHIERVLTQTAWATDEEITGLLMQIGERTRTQAQILEKLRSTVPGSARAGLERAVTVCRQAAQAAEDGLDDPQTFRRRYRHQQGTPEPTHEPEQGTATPGDDQEQGSEYTPVGTLHIAPQGPQVTHGPQATPHGPQATRGPQTTPHGQQPTPTSQVTPQGPQATPHGPQSTHGPQATPQGPQATHGPPATTPQPQQPGSEQGGSGN